MSYNTELQDNNAELEELLEMANSLPDAVAGSFIVTATAGDGEVTGVSATFAAMYAAYQSGKHLILIISSPYTDSASLLQCDYVSPDNIIFSALSTATGENIAYSVNISSDDTNTYLSNEVGGVDEEELNAAVESALTEAKESGEFDGPPGTDGVSPTITVITITGGHRITITDKNGTKNVDIMDGADGRGIQSIARTSGTGAAGTTDTYTITYTDNTTTTFTVYNGSNGKDGTSVTVSKVTESSESEGTNVVTFSDGSTLNVKNGRDGEDGADGDDYVLTAADKNEIADSIATGLTLGVHTDGLVYIFKDGVPLGNGIEMGSGGDVIGYVDSENNIVLTGNLADGTYSVKYEMEGGSTVSIGNLTLDTNVYYSVTNTLTNCKNSNSATQVVEGNSYSATITADDGYELISLAVTMGGSAVSVSGGVINIASVTGDIVITAIAEEKQAAEPVTENITLLQNVSLKGTNFDEDRTGTTGYCATPSIDLTNIPKPCTIHLTDARWTNTNASDSGYIRCSILNTSGTKLVGDYTHPSKMPSGVTMTVNNGDESDVTVTVTGSNIGKVRFAGMWTWSGLVDKYPDYGAVMHAKATLTYTPK